MCDSWVLSGNAAVGSWQIRRLARRASKRGVAWMFLQYVRSCMLFGWQMGYRICIALMCVGLVSLDAMLCWLSMLAVDFTFRFHIVLEIVLDAMLLISLHCVCCVLRCVRYALFSERIVFFISIRWGVVQSLYRSFHLAAVACSSYSIISVSHPFVFFSAPAGRQAGRL